jgi:hypothetical protein
VRVAAGRAGKEFRSAQRIASTVSRIFVIIGFFLVLILLVTNGLIGGGLCVKGVGCMYSTGDGLRLDNSERATIGTR